MTPRLDHHVLERLRAAWRDAGALVADHLRPGLSEPEIQEGIRVEAGLDPPAEAITWWSWCDGAEQRRPAYAVGPSLYLLSLSEALDKYREQRELAAQAAARHAAGVLSDPDYWWSEAWIPLLESDGSNVVACDFRAGSEEHAPVWVIDWFDYHPESGPVLSSLVDLVHVWLRQLAEGAWAYNQASAIWERTGSHYDPRLSPAGLV